MASPQETTASVVVVVAKCLCGQNEATVQVAGPLPQHKHICHCNPCRYTTGVLFHSALSLTTKPDFVHSLARYNSSEKLSRYFCPICGSHMLIHIHQHDHWDLCSGVVDRVVDGGEEGGEVAGAGVEGTATATATALEIYTGHEFIEDTVDGGLGVCFTTDAEGKDVEFFMQGPDGETISPSRYLSRRKSTPQPRGSDSGGRGDDAFTSTTTTSGSTNTNTKLHASCHCGGVQYAITRPTAASRAFSAPWPDLIVSSQASHTANPDDVKWWLRANDTKYLAGTCVCRSCRTASGPPVQTWAFVPRTNLELGDGSPWRPEFGSLAQHRSSEGCVRHFCRICGATAFWRSEVRPELIDVSVGLLRAPEGARAENWLEWWTARVSFAEDALDTSLAATLGAGLSSLALREEEEEEEAEE